MLDFAIKNLLLNQTPSTLTIDGHEFVIDKTLGSTPLNKLALPTINIEFMNEGTPYYESVDLSATINDNITTYNKILKCKARYTIAAKDVIIETTESHTYKTGTNEYTLNRAPILDIISVDTYKKNIDYKLNNDHQSITWLTSLSNNTIFNVNYKWINSGYSISNQLINYIMKDVLGRILDLLKKYNLNILEFDSVKDISNIYVSDSFNAFTFDIVITYPFNWNVTLSDEDAVVAENFVFDLIFNDKYIKTITNG